jgi:hypothetical protein
MRKRGPSLLLALALLGGTVGLFAYVGGFRFLRDMWFGKFYQCSATTTYLGSPRTGTGADLESESLAREFALKDICRAYCADVDPAVDAKLRETGRHVRYARITWATHNTAVRPTFDACVTRCTAATANQPVNVTCRRDK